jgi:hypothetical protein
MSKPGFDAFAEQHPAAAAEIRAALTEMRALFQRMQAGELDVVEVGKRAKVLQNQDFEGAKRRFLEEMLSSVKMTRAKEQELRDSLGSVHYGGAEDATLGPDHRLLARYQIGSGGAHANDYGSLRGACARSVNKMLLPEQLSNAAREAIVTELLVSIGFSDTTRQHVNSILRHQRRG